MPCQLPNGNPGLCCFLEPLLLGLSLYSIFHQCGHIGKNDPSLQMSQLFFDLGLWKTWPWVRSQQSSMSWARLDCNYKKRLPLQSCLSKHYVFCTLFPYLHISWWVLTLHVKDIKINPKKRLVMPPKVLNPPNSNANPSWFSFCEPVFRNLAFWMIS